MCVFGGVLNVRLLSVLRGSLFDGEIKVYYVTQVLKESINIKYDV